MAHEDRPERPETEGAAKLLAAGMLSLCRGGGRGRVLGHCQGYVCIISLRRWGAHEIAQTDDQTTMIRDTIEREVKKK